MSFGNSTDWPAHQSTLSCPQFRKCTKRWGKQRIAVNLIEPPPCAYRQHMGKKESADTEKEKEHESRGGPVHLCPPQAPRRSESARSGGGKSFQQREAANLNDPRKADVRCLGVRKMLFRVISRVRRILSPRRRASGTAEPQHHHSYERKCDHASSRSISIEAYDTHPAPGGRVGGSAGSSAH
ncbi:uncharacterized protein LOC135080114 isoform X3 [Ostrinia nubilalis]|uniref:uncharacterized protein LOC135074939 isoform X1 n=1 Tax=Ostrinia nubilalis TaxID=29057 RepID=UPI00308235F2